MIRTFTRAQAARIWPEGIGISRPQSIARVVCDTDPAVEGVVLHVNSDGLVVEVKGDGVDLHRIKGSLDVANIATKDVIAYVGVSS